MTFDLGRDLRGLVIIDARDTLYGVGVTMTRYGDNRIFLLGDLAYNNGLYGQACEDDL